MNSPKKALAFFCAFFLQFGISNAQLTSAQILKRFVKTDTSDSNKDAMLILYADNTFLNFGIYSNKKEGDAFVWYSFGTWTGAASSIMLESKLDLFDTNNLVKCIKFHYKRRKDHLLIENSYEFVREFCKKKKLEVQDEHLVDPKKAITYNEDNI